MKNKKIDLGRYIAVFVQELADAELLTTSENPTPRSLTGKDLVNLTFLDAIFHESLRVLPPAPSGSLRTLQVDTELAGFVVPKGTSVIVSPWAIHRNTLIWGEDAKRWRPDRWLEGHSINQTKRDSLGSLRWLPFMDGRQNCIGQHIATV
jgi:cytochrome P450